MYIPIGLIILSTIISVYSIFYGIYCNHFDLSYVLNLFHYSVCMYGAVLYSVFTYRKTAWAKTTHKKITHIPGNIK